MSLREVKSPLAPKITIEQGSMILRPRSRRQINNSSSVSGCSMAARMAKPQTKSTNQLTKSHLQSALPIGLIRATRDALHVFFGEKDRAAERGGADKNFGRLLG